MGKGKLRQSKLLTCLTVAPCPSILQELEGEAVYAYAEKRTKVDRVKHAHI